MQTSILIERRVDSWHSAGVKIHDFLSGQIERAMHKVIIFSGTVLFGTIFFFGGVFMGRRR